VWVPGSAAEIEAAARTGGLRETASFDAKKQLPVARKNESLAVDVAAMSTDGGCLLYGLGEDEEHRLVVDAPFRLAGAADRVAQIVSTSIMEPPYVEFREYETDDDPSLGYLLVIVPQSARAPHQVTVGGDLRFYGRAAKGNRILTEGDIARLYERRLGWEQDRSVLLQEAVGANRARFRGHTGTVTAFARPVLPDAAIWERAAAAAGGRDGLQHALQDAARWQQTATAYDPSFARSILDWHQLGSDELRLSTLQRNQDPTDASLTALEALLRVDGSARLFSARAAFEDASGHAYPGRVLTVTMEFIIAGNRASFLAMVSKLYDLGGYHGHLDVGVAVDGLQDAASITIVDRVMNRASYGADEFRRNERISATELHDPRSVANRLLKALFDLTTGHPDFDAFAWVRETSR
jgi:hypothetical protein